MKKNIFLIILFLSVTTACFAQKFAINATITGFKDQTKFILKDITNDVIIDSAIIINNKFGMRGQVAAEPHSYWLSATYNGKFYYVVLFISNDKIKITGDISDFPFDLHITGSPSQDKSTSLNNQTKALYKQRNTLVAEYVALKGDSATVAAKSKQIWHTIGKLDSIDDIIRKRFIKENLNSYTAVSELTYLKSRYSKDTLQKMYDELIPKYKQSEYGKIIAIYLKVGNPVKTGDAYVDFEAWDKEGLAHKLSDIKGKYILLDFSATNCGPCVESVKDMKLLTKQYPGKLAIVTFSEDAAKKTWLESIHRDSPDWLSVWDGKGDNSETSLKYGVTGYPTFFLINPEGKIVTSIIGYGDGSLAKTIKGIIK